MVCSSFLVANAKDWWTSASKSYSRLLYINPLDFERRKRQQQIKETRKMSSYFLAQWAQTFCHFRRCDLYSFSAMLDVLSKTAEIKQLFAWEKFYAQSHQSTKEATNITNYSFTSKKNMWTLVVTKTRMTVLFGAVEGYDKQLHVLLSCPAIPLSLRYLKDQTFWNM